MVMHSVRFHRRLIVLLALPFAVAGCRKQDASRSVVTIHVADWGGASADARSQAIEANTLAEFHRLHPNIHVEREHMPDSYVPKVLMTVLAHTEPDVIALDASSAAIFINNGVLRDLTPFIEHDPQVKLSGFFPNVVNVARRGKALYAMPANFTPMMMWYNKASFRRAGVPYPKDGWTWDDFLATAKRLHMQDKNGQTVQYGFEVTSWMPGWVMWIWQNGGDVLSPDGTHASGYLDGPKSVEAIRFYTDLERKWHVSPSTSQEQALGDLNFEAGRVPMMVSGHWVIPSFLANENVHFNDIGVVGLPRKDKRVTVIYESGPAMMKASRHPKEAWEYIKFMTGPWVQKQYAETGIGVSANRRVAEGFRGRTAQEPAFLDNIQYARGPWGDTVEQYALVEDIGKEAIEEIRLGKATPQDALTRAAKRIDVQLGEE